MATDTPAIGDMRSTKCEECGFEWDTTGPDELVRLLHPAHRRFEQATRNLDASTLKLRPTPTVWSAAEYLGHVADVIEWYATRIARVLDEERPKLIPRDWDATATERRYNDQPASVHLQAIADNSSRLADTLARLTPHAWDRAGTGSNAEQRTILDLARRAAHEVIHHLHDVASTSLTTQPAELHKFDPQNGQ